MEAFWRRCSAEGSCGYVEWMSVVDCCCSCGDSGECSYGYVAAAVHIMCNSARKRYSHSRLWIEGTEHGIDMIKKSTPFSLGRKEKKNKKERQHGLLECHISNSSNSRSNL